jgi:RNA 3'-terminal phosphate cyclase
VGRAVGLRLRQELEGNGTVDVHTADNLMVPAALFGGQYSFAQHTGHIETNAWVIDQFLPGRLRLVERQVVGAPGVAD